MSVILTVTDTQTDNGETDLKDVEAQDEEEDAENAREAELVVFDNTSQGLGLKVIGGCSEDGQEEAGIFIKRILPGGLAEQHGGLQEEDLILEVNGHSMEGVTYDEAIDILRQSSASNHVEMIITRDEEARQDFAELMSRYATDAQHALKNGDTVRPAGPIANGEQEEFPPHMAGYYRQTAGLRTDTNYNEKVDGNDFLDPHLDEDGGSSCHSPASSCHSELVHHLSGAATPTTTNNGHHHHHHHQGAAQSVNAASLNTMLSHSFPLMLDHVDPNCRFPVPKLEKTLERLGFVISTQKHIELLKHIPVDAQGLTTFAEFVQAVRYVFRDDLKVLSNSQRSTPLIPTESPPNSISPAPQMNGFAGEREQDNPLIQENEFLREQIETLKEELAEQKRLCLKAEEQVLSLRKETQGAVEESRSLRTKLRLAEQSQEAARKMEQDYEQVVAMLENEISHLRLQMAKSDGINEQRRLAVAVCQLKKSEQGKKTFEVASGKLMNHLQHVQDILSAESTHSRSGDADKGEKKKRRQKMLQTLLSEGQEVIRTVQTLLEQVPLPFGWEESYTADGVRYYINHLNQTTAWTHPSSNVEHQSIAMPTPATGTSRPDAADAGK